MSQFSRRGRLCLAGRPMVLLALFVCPCVAQLQPLMIKYPVDADTVIDGNPVAVYGIVRSARHRDNDQVPWVVDNPRVRVELFYNANGDVPIVDGSWLGDVTFVDDTRTDGTWSVDTVATQLNGVIWPYMYYAVALDGELDPTNKEDDVFVAIGNQVK